MAKPKVPATATVAPKSAKIVLRKPPECTCSQTGRRLKDARLEELTGLSQDRLVGMYRRMCLIREFEEECATLYRSGRVRGVTHTSQGQEATVVGTTWNLHDDDYITSTHRGHAHILAKGGDEKACMAELLGKATGYCKGRGGSMHIADMSKGILGANGIVAGGAGIAVGSALASQMLGNGRITVCFIGDGALNEGIAHEVANMAAIWKLPVIFLVENNLYGMSGCVDDMLAVGERGFFARSDAYGIPGSECDGMDVVDVFMAVGEAAERARGGGGPSFVFCHTYRFLGHHVGDPLTYRHKQEPGLWKKLDPIPKFGELLVQQAIATEKDVRTWGEEARKAIEEAVRFAEESPEPEPSLIMEDVFA